MLQIVMEHSKRKQIRQPPEVPFLWEVKPGVPKTDWKHEVSFCPILIPPVKLIASVPFNWEEKPGKPLPCFSEPSPLLPTSPQNLITFPSPPQGYVEIDNSQHDQKGLFALDLEVFDFETDDDPFSSSAPSLLANCLVPSATLSSAVPVDKSSSTDDDFSWELDIPSSPASETDSTTSSYATGISSSLVGASFLECLFPLLQPNSSFLEKVKYSDEGSPTPPEVMTNHESSSSVVVRKPATLGELIMMSRRRSCQRKAVQMRKQNMSMEFMKKASRCSIFGTSINMIEGLQTKKHQSILKLLLK